MYKTEATSLHAAEYHRARLLLHWRQPWGISTSPWYKWKESDVLAILHPFRNKWCIKLVVPCCGYCCWNWACVYKTRCTSKYVKREAVRESATVLTCVLAAPTTKALHTEEKRMRSKDSVNLSSFPQRMILLGLVYIGWTLYCTASYANLFPHVLTIIERESCTPTTGNLQWLLSHFNFNIWLEVLPVGALVEALLRTCRTHTR